MKSDPPDWKCLSFQVIRDQLIKVSHMYKEQQNQSNDSLTFFYDVKKVGEIRCKIASRDWSWKRIISSPRCVQIFF